MKILLMGILLLTIFSPARLLASDPLSWCSPDFSPYFIKKGELKNKGINDLIIQYLQARLPQYQHNYLKANPSRIINELSENRKLVCSALLKTPEREKKMLFSQLPLFLVHPNHLVILKSRRAFFKQYIQESGAIDLNTLLDSRLVLGVATNRIYSGDIDAFVVDYESKDSVVKTTSSNIYLGLLKMLQRKRIDFTFGYPIETTYLATKLKMDELFEVIPVVNMQALYPVYITAPKTLWGEKTLSNIEAVYNNPEAILHFSSFYQTWLDDVTKIRYQIQVADYYKEFF
ncbi:MAG: TIGR02285 family protein [Psychromonas sp.]|nr:TIGR02285 family protein [Psychromonas sp.]